MSDSDGSRCRDIIRDKAQGDDDDPGPRPKRRATGVNRGRPVRSADGSIYRAVL